MDEIGTDPDVGDDEPKRPFITTLIGLFIVGLIIHSFATSEPVQFDVMIAVAAVEAAVIAPIIWLICLAIAIRKATIGWKVGSFMLFLLVGFLVRLGIFAPNVPPAPPELQAPPHVQIVVPNAGKMRTIEPMTKAEFRRQSETRSSTNSEAFLDPVGQRT